MKTASSAQTMKKKASNRTAWEAALFLLRYRPQSEWEVRTKLRRKGYSLEEIGETVEKLRDARYLDDGELSDDLFRYYRDNALCGDLYIQRKLKARGLSTDQHLTEEEERAKAELAFAKKKAIVPALAANYRKAAGFLLRKGFPPFLVREVLAVHMEEEPFLE